ncbi:MAG: hypothetical protein A2508_07205 [Candidatus Lambdaproteobacteria bacterium RIFOXYD12_FULL_49_8]|uniref:Uncharacterized protein n=1 Tax=Candidatus Lambdaproteobacteria bacterium RIFOXYD2_FULL_50_16 TaxID=1817772 RepID=A0A1F6G7K4_9PROT|nr:MAG: hypothetical protein A3K03_02945 [Bdellovibrionales bacterium RIFOXYD1_FULL_44_7]OGG94077.1 MAG: hypothetical protein A2527_09505 [Candidatus Lambdaproteobacteria bacterium RIFOXYD2_FULL_50_16]OGG97317.1 MAG: hypothetical protein A2508_07205 [Candidatus Lambdaproteobacteria bacterium RIFOXYD12_FULL_49_8]
MNLLITFLALLMVADSFFALTNLRKVQNWLEDYFPNLDIKKLALVEGVAGLLILLLKLVSHSLI